MSVGVFGQGPRILSRRRADWLNLGDKPHSLTSIPFTAMTQCLRTYRPVYVRAASRDNTQFLVQVYMNLYDIAQSCCFLAEVPVTKDNLIRYFHLMAHYKTNVQFERQRVAFLRGLGCVVPLSWLKMFDPYELNSLISGSIAGFDVGDLRQHTVYYGGYRDDSPVVTWLWQLLQSMDPEDMGRFLMFVTSCSRAPLLGFKTMYPQFCVHRVPDSHRLPTASTCANLLKLPDYSTFEILKSKVMQAIRSEAGFDLS